VKPLVLTRREEPPERLDLSTLLPTRLTGLTEREIAAIELQTTRHKITVGDVFRVRMGDVDRLRIDGGCARLDRIGHRMDGGEITVEGDVGIEAGRLMTGGVLIVEGSVGRLAASGMKGGAIRVAGDAGERLGGPLPGETAGMRGGVVVVRGDVGERCGDRMRRGTILIEGGAGPHAGSRMIAGTLIVRRRAGALPGYLMRRGTIVMGAGTDEISPTFVDGGVHHLLIIRLLASFVTPLSTAAASMLRRPLRRYTGDMAVLGKGELFIAD
jgi:formylmethanofuran dehydrogenase subunit C